MIGVPIETLKKLFQGKRTITQEHLNLILLETGVEFSASVPKKGSSFLNKNWEAIKDHASNNKSEFVEESLNRAAEVLLVADSKKQLLVALYLFEKSIQKLVHDLDLNLSGERFGDDFPIKRLNEVLSCCVTSTKGTKSESRNTEL